MDTPESTELQQRLRALRSERSPTRELWPGIAAQLPARPALAPSCASVPASALRARPRYRRRGRLLSALAACASLVLVVVLGLPQGPASAPPSPLDQLLVREAAALDRQYAAAYAQFERGPMPPALQPGLVALSAEAARVHAALLESPQQQRLFDELKRLHERRLQLLMRSIEATA
jgi:hypothetical protein